MTRPGGEAKIAALGLKVKNGCTYHGVAVNVDMDLSPFAAIDPCGYAGLAVTQLEVERLFLGEPSAQGELEGVVRQLEAHDDPIIRSGRTVAAVVE